MSLAVARLCVVLIFLGGVCGQAQTPKEGKGKSQNQQPPANQQTPTPQPQATPSQVPAEQPKAEVARQDRQDQQDQAKGWYTPEGLNALVNALLLVFIAFQTAIYRRQLNLMQVMREIGDRQAGIMETQAGAMQNQLEAMQVQAVATQESLTETRNLVAQNERAVKAAEKSVNIAEDARRSAEMDRAAREVEKIYEHDSIGIQTRAMQGQLNAMREQVSLAMKQVEAMMVSERAYLGIEQIGMTDLEVGKTPRIVMIMKNAGRTPAKKISAPGKISIEPVGTQPAVERIKSQYLGEGMLAANTVRTVVYEFPVPYDVNTAYQVATGTAAIFIQGTIWYEDAWGNEWNESFFLEWDNHAQAFLDRREKKAGEREQQNAKQPPADS